MASPGMALKALRLCLGCVPLWLAPLCLAPLCLAPLWSAPQTTPSLAELWYREVLEGQVAQAAREYEAIYLSQPTARVPRALQQQAAFGAGRCFEQLSAKQSAEPAYLAAARLKSSPLEVAEAPASELLAAEAILRLRDLRADAALHLVEDDVSLGLAVRAGIEVLRATEKARAGILADLENLMAELTSTIELRRELQRRLESRGVRLRISQPGGTGPLDAALAQLGEILGPEVGLGLLVRRALRDRSLSQALEYLLARDTGNAWLASRRFRLLSSPAGPGALAGELPPLDSAYTSLLAELLEVLGPAGGERPALSSGDLDRLSRLARRRQLDLELDHKSTLLGELFKVIDDADAADARGRKQDTWSFLDKARQLLDWSSNALREDNEVLALAVSARIKSRVLTRNAELDVEWTRLGAVLRHQVDRIVEVVSGVLDRAAEDALSRAPVELTGRVDADAVCQVELEALLAVVRSGSGTGGDGHLVLDKDGAAALWQALWLAEWAPAMVTPARRSLLTTLAAGLNKGAKKKI